MMIDMTYYGWHERTPEACGSDNQIIFLSLFVAMQQKETVERSSEATLSIPKRQGIISRVAKSIFSLFKHIPITPFRG